MGNVAGAVGRSNLVVGLFVRRADGMNIGLVGVYPILSILLRVVRRVDGLGVYASIGQTFREASAYNGNQMDVYSNEEDSASDGDQIVAAAIFYLGGRGRIGDAYVRFNVIFFRRVRRIFDSERFLLQVSSVRQASRDDVARRVVDVDGGNERF